MNNVQDTAGAAGNVSVKMGVMVGDVTGNGVVTNTDVGVVKAQVNPTVTVTDSNFREDVTCNGFVTNTDVATVKAKVDPTVTLPPPPP